MFGRVGAVILCDVGRVVAVDEHARAGGAAGEDRLGTRRDPNLAAGSALSFRCRSRRTSYSRDYAAANVDSLA